MAVMEREDVVYDEEAVMGLANWIAQKFNPRQVTVLLGTTEDDLTLSAARLSRIRTKNGNINSYLPEMVDSSDFERESCHKAMFRLALLRVREWRKITSYHRHSR